ncbi:acyl-CoA dehydrogenase family protein [Streptomyces tricolor]|nr:acyl-CoA dehydrogenase family protein [Streptomyces tricolor]
MGRASRARRCRPWRRRRASRRTARGRPSWPRTAGRWCRGRSGTAGGTPGLLRWLVFEEEVLGRRARRAGSARTASPCSRQTLFAYGTEEQRARVLPPMATGEVVWAQAWSEPEAGSDLAALASRAVRTDGGWLISGLKTWSSRAAFADRAFGLFRSDPATGRPHEGLTYLMFDLRAPGVTVRPVGRLDGRPAFAGAVPGRGVRPGRGRDRRAGPGLGDRHVRDGRRTRAHPAPPGRFLASAAAGCGTCGGPRGRPGTPGPGWPTP